MRSRILHGSPQGYLLCLLASLPTHVPHCSPEPCSSGIQKAFQPPPQRQGTSPEPPQPCLGRAALSHSFLQARRPPPKPTPIGCFPDSGLAQPPGPASHVAKLVPPLFLPRLLSTAVSCLESAQWRLPPGTHPGVAPARQSLTGEDCCVTLDRATPSLGLVVSPEK